MNEHTRHVSASTVTSSGVEPPYIETQPDRTDLPLAVMPCVVASMIEPFRANLPLLHDVARVRMYTDTTLDEDEIARRATGADAVMVIGFHVGDSLLDRLGINPPNPSNRRGDSRTDSDGNSDSISHTDSHGGGNTVRCFAFGGTGVASYIDLDAARSRGISVRNVVHYGDSSVAEHAFALLMELSRGVGRLDAAVRRGDWSGADGFALNGKTLGIAGFGGIGRAVARIARGFGMRVAVWNSHVDPVAARELGVVLVDDLGDLMARSDAFSVHLPLLESTAGLITAGHLDRLRPGTLFVNTARAEVIEHGALSARLARGDIRAGLDVFEHEPLPADDPLRSMPNVVLTPHVAWRDDEAYVSLTHQVFQAVASFFKGGDYNAVV